MWAKRFLEDLAHDREKYPRMPKSVRKEAYSILRHFPSSWDLKNASIGAPDVFQERMEPLTRMIMVYDEEQKEEQNDKTI